MSLNKYMHPRNRYKNKKPSFLELALKYPDFRKQVTQDESGKVFLDFKNADALRALTTCLLKEDFDLTVDLPTDRLVPTLPLRLNYIHWLEEIVGTEEGKWGIDIGTGASCVYPLLAAKVQKWNFLATEADPENFFHAQKNVESNNLKELIHVKQVSVEDALLGPVESFTLTESFDFCMCNPPFFADHMEAQAISTSRSIERPEAQTVSTASPQECIAKGGEVGFVRQMIEESAILRNKIRVYSSMVGKKTSLAQLKEELRHHMVPKFSTTEFCQGKTMRWGIAWSFDESVQFPKSQFEVRKEKPPLQYVIPQGSGGVEYKVHAIAGFLKDLLASIKVHCYQGKTAKSYTSITLTAAENTWCHQRRRRRQQKRQEEGEEKDRQTNERVESSRESLNKADKGGGSDDNSKVESSVGKEVAESGVSKISDSQKDNEKSDSTAAINDKKRLASDEIQSNPELPAKMRKVENSSENGSVEETRLKNAAKEEVNGNGSKNAEKEKFTSPKKSSRSENLSSEEHLSSPSKEIKDTSFMSTNSEENESPKEFILKCVLRLKKAGVKINMELEWLEGGSRELMHQIKTFLVNKLAESK